MVKTFGSKNLPLVSAIHFRLIAYKQSRIWRKHSVTIKSQRPQISASDTPAIKPATPWLSSFLFFLEQSEKNADP